MKNPTSSAQCVQQKGWVGFGGVWPGEEKVEKGDLAETAGASRGHRAPDEHGIIRESLDNTAGFSGKENSGINLSEVL